MIYPKITIITPSFNQGNYIEQTIKSVLNQNYPNLEYIIIDGGSTDGTIDIIKKYETKITYWISEKDNGQSHAINKGLKMATGEIVNWLNSDDYYEEGALFKIANYFEKQKINVVCAKSRIFSDDKKIDFFSLGSDIYNNNLPKTIGWARMDQPETFFRKSAINRMGFLNEDLHYVMDKEWWIRYLLHFGSDNIVKTNEVIVNFRLHNNSKTVLQKDGFERETNNLFYNLADFFNLSIEKTILSDLEEVKPILYSSDYLQFDKNLILTSIHYYFLYKADEYYYNNKREKAKLLLKNINTSLINHSDLKLFQKLNKRINIPVWLTKLLRRIND